MARGFTLIELVLLICIIMVIVAVVYSNRDVLLHSRTGPAMECTWQIDRRVCLCQIAGDDDWQIAPDHACNREANR